MTKFGPLGRTLALAGLLLSSPMVAAPVYAAAADVALLKTYIGSWSGTGTLTGANSETVKCKLTLKEGNSDKINYSGRCVLAGTNLSINGTLAFVDENNRFEAAMTSNATFTGVAVGKKSGDGVVFNLKEQGTDDDGNDMTITAAIALKSGSISVQFQVVYNETGDIIKASVPFSQ